MFMVKFPKFFSLHPATQALIAILLFALSYSFIQIIIVVIEYYTGDIANELMKWGIVFGVSIVALLLLGVSTKKIRQRIL
jgi:hypothetical protein